MDGEDRMNNRDMRSSLTGDYVRFGCREEVEVMKNYMEASRMMKNNIEVSRILGSN